MGLVIYNGHHADGVKALCLCLSFREAGPAYVQAGQLTDGCAQGAAIPQFFTHNVLGNDPAVDIGCGAHRRPGWFSRDGAVDHGAVSGGVNVGIVGLTRLIGQQGSFYHFQARAIQEGGIGPDTGAEDHQVCLIGFPVSQNFFDFAAFPLQAGHTNAGDHRDAGIRQLSFYVSGKLPVKARQNMRRHVQHKGFHSIFCQVFCNLQANIAGAHNHSPFDSAIGDQIPQGNGVLWGAHEEHIFQIHALNRRTDWTGSCRNDQLVIGIYRLFPGVQVNGGHLLGITVHFHGFHPG